MYWTVGNGKQILYKDLSHDHFMNIIADGYRNPHLMEEGKKRGISIPKRAVDDMTEVELGKLAEKMIDRAMKDERYDSDKAREKVKVQAIINIERLKKMDYHTYLLYLSRFFDNRDESIRD